MDAIQQIIDLALAEDIGSGDVTTEAVFGAGEVTAAARIYAKEDLILAGCEVMGRVFSTVDDRLDCQTTANDGAQLQSDMDIAIIKGSAASLLKAERTALNFLQHLSGIATYTARFVKAVEGTDVIIRDTRKTTPGMRALEKAATKAGGAENHRMGLYDQVLIKDNHIAASGSIAACVQQVLAAPQLAGPVASKVPAHNEGVMRQTLPRTTRNIKIQVEVRTSAEAQEAITAGVDSLLLDNMSYELATQIAEQFREQIELEVSGGVTLDNVASWAETGVHAISIGALTHSAPAVDIAMEMKV